VGVDGERVPHLPLSRRKGWGRGIAGDAGSSVRGRSWDGIPWNLRVSSRDNYPVSDRYYFLGFRCARDESP